MQRHRSVQSGVRYRYLVREIACYAKPMTYSILARDPETGELGFAVASMFFAAAAVVPHIRGPRGAVATQSYLNPLWGTEGIERLNAGEDPEVVLADVVSRDSGASHRQCHMIDIDGRIAQYTGEDCGPWAGHERGPDVSAAGNILTGPAVVKDMVTAYLDSAGQALPYRLLAALDAAEAAGGDSRGRQSAGLVISRGEDWRYLDLRVDDHSEPLVELRRLLDVSEEAFQPLMPHLPTRDSFSRMTDPEEVMKDIEEMIARRTAAGKTSQSRQWARPGSNGYRPPPTEASVAE